MTSSTEEIAAIRAQAHIHHAYFLGLQLMIATRKGSQVMEKWMFNLFRRQHLDKFLSSFDKLGLSDLPHAVACAKYHVLSNNIGGVGVEYMAESDRKAWVRFRYPRWMYAGPAICGVPVEVSRGFLNGWYAYNGVSLGNPRLGFVCVSEDMTGEYGLCGYFYEYDHDLAPHERLQFAKDEQPPAYLPEDQPEPPGDQWNTLRLEKANRNYAMEYVRNGLCELRLVMGDNETLKLGSLAARLIGLQYFQETLSMIGAQDGDLKAAGHYLSRMLTGMGDDVQLVKSDLQTDRFEVRQKDLRIVRGLQGEERSMVLACWIELWRGTLASQQQQKSADVQINEDSLIWSINS
ncbi:MAG: hypothetical protein V2I41_11025 [Pseudomonadales bacterium]|nr:hypothetical protein [Pseudomonadales bacterium]